MLPYSACFEQLFGFRTALYFRSHLRTVLILAALLWPFHAPADATCCLSMPTSNSFPIPVPRCLLEATRRSQYDPAPSSFPEPEPRSHPVLVPRSFKRIEVLNNLSLLKCVELSCEFCHIQDIGTS